MGGTYSRQKPMRFIIQGLYDAGKTSFLYRLKLGEFITTIPTIGFNVESIYSSEVEIASWDVGGRCGMRPLYRHYYPETDGIIYVIDSADVDRVDESLDELNRNLQSPELEGVVVMVVANKQDLEGALGPEKVESKIKERCSLINSISLFVMACSVVTGDGLHESFHHLVKQVKMKKDGKLPPGLIPSAWKMANEKDEHKRADDIAPKDCDSPSNFHKIKTSLFKDPLISLKSFLFY